MPPPGNHEYGEMLLAVDFTPPPPPAVQLQAVPLGFLHGGVGRMIHRAWRERTGDWREDVVSEALFAIQKAIAKAHRAASRNKSGLGMLAMPYAHWLLLHHRLSDTGANSVHNAIDWVVKNHPNAYRYQLRTPDTEK